MSCGLMRFYEITIDPDLFDHIALRRRANTLRLGVRSVSVCSVFCNHP